MTEIDALISLNRKEFPERSGAPPYRMVIELEIFSPLTQCNLAFPDPHHSLSLRATHRQGIVLRLSSYYYIIYYYHTVVL